MKASSKLLVLLMSLFAMSVTSCINDELTDGQAPGAGKVLSVEDQAAAIEATMSDIEALQAALGENANADLETAAAALESHVADLRSGVSMIEGTIATLEQQRKLAAVTGLIAAADEEGNLTKSLENLEKGVKAWLGKTFTEYYSAAFAEAEASVRLSALDIRSQKINVEGLLSDVEAGLRQTSDPEELTTLAAEVATNAEEAEKLMAVLVELTDEVEMEYTKAVETAINEPENFDAPAVKSVNKAVATTLAETQDDLASLVSRVAACEAQLNSIVERLGALEGEVKGFEELLNMIQSVTLMTEYSADEAVAYYNMGYETTSEGYKKRTPTGTIELRYLVRPASTATALTESTLWNNGLKVFGYYANRIEQSSVGQLVNFNITNVTADSSTGVITVTVDNALKEDFYYKKTGAKMALSVTTGKTDLTSKFVEIVPKDQSGSIYLESISLEKDEVEFDEGDELNLKAILNPSNVTVKELTWTTDNIGVVSVSGAGRIAGTGVGQATITVTSKGTDEWGRTLSASCTVKVNPAIKLSGPSYVEQGKTAELTLDFPSSMLIESKVWYTSDESKVTVSDGVISGVANTYNEYTYEYSPVIVYCKINDNITLSHEVKVVVPQPRQVKFNNYADDAREITVKVGQNVSLAGTILPAETASNFRLFYESNSGVLGWVDSETGVIKGNSSVGTVSVYARVFEIDKHRRFAPGKSFTREMVVKVEPYYVTSITLPSAFELEPGATGSISAALKSDVEGEAPTYTDLTWTSSNTDVLTIDPITGEYEAKAIGSALITATAPSKSTVPGEDPAYATVGVTVTKKENKPNVGDYYYADGTWSPDYNPTAGNPVIGIVFYADNPYLQDPTLPSSCINGLAVGLTEYNAPIGFISTNNTAWEINKAGHYLGNKEKTNGYANTVALSNYSMGKPDDSGYGIGYAQMFRYDKKGIPGQYNVSHSELSSQWYIPSYKEMSLIRDNKNIINNKLTSIGDAVNSDAYWLSTFDINSSTNINGVYLFDMSTGKWKTSLHASGASVYTVPAPVRVVLAF